MSLDHANSDTVTGTSACCWISIKHMWKLSRVRCVYTSWRKLWDCQRYEWIRVGFILILLEITSEMIAAETCPCRLKTNLLKLLSCLQLLFVFLYLFTETYLFACLVDFFSNCDRYTRWGTVSNTICHASSFWAPQWWHKHSCEPNWVKSKPYSMGGSRCLSS